MTPITRSTRFGIPYGVNSNCFNFKSKPPFLSNFFFRCHNQSDQQLSTFSLRGRVGLTQLKSNRQLLSTRLNQQVFCSNTPHEPQENSGEDHYDKPLEISLSLRAKSMPRTARTLYQLILDRLNGGDLEEAKSFFGSFKKLSGGLFREEGEICVLLGLDCLDKGKLEEAEEYSNNSLKIFQTLFGENNPRVTTSHSLLILICLAQEKSGEAKVMTSHGLLGLVCLAQGKLGEAKKHFQLSFPEEPALPPLSEHSMESRQKLFNNTSLNLALNYHNLGQICQTKGDEVKAKDYFNSSQEIFEKFLGWTHLEIFEALEINDLFSRIHFVNSLYQTGDLDQLVSYFEKSLWAYQLFFAIGCSDLGLRCQANGYLNEAVLYLEKSLEICENVGGQTDHVKRIIYNQLGNIYLERGDLEEAFKHLRKLFNTILNSL